jgi:cysteine desulfurase
MRPYFSEHYGNPASQHVVGRIAYEAMTDARGQVAALLGCDADEVIFTSGATESDNLAIKGILFAGDPAAGGHIVISAIEHAAITQPALFMQRLGYEVTVVPCDNQGIVQPEAISGALQRNTRLVSVMHANNEIGTIQPIREIAQVCHERGVLLHTDAAQSVGKIPALVDALDVDLLSIAGHKFYGPKGVGALFVREGIQLEPVLHGTDHELGFRGGTENVPYIVGLGAAAAMVGKTLDEAALRMEQLRDDLASRLQASVDGLRVNGSLVQRLPNTLSVTFPRVSGRDLLQRTPQLCASTGAACNDQKLHASPVLLGLGYTPQAAQGTVRLSVGWHTSHEEIELAADWLIDAWENLVK